MILKTQPSGRYYRLTPAGRKKLAEQTSRWREIVSAMERVLRPVED
jgi:DNA-binding PadR family transcriptional regulator